MGADDKIVDRCLGELKRWRKVDFRLPENLSISDLNFFLII
jgi:hypothetical protein